MLDLKLIADIREWQQRRFPQASYAGTAEHQRREREELAEELADRVFLLIQSEWLEPDVTQFGRQLWLTCRAAQLLGVDLEDAVRRKLAKNQARTWPAAPDAAGVYEHVKTNA